MKRPDRVPFFARFIELDTPTFSTDLRAGINLPDVRFETKKYPSDGDEGGVVVRVRFTLKPGGDKDE